MLFLNHNFLSFPKGALIFGLSRILCSQENRGNYLFTLTVLAFNFHFSAIGLNLQEKQVHQTKILVLKQL
jgi:hypothetical protein